MELTAREKKRGVWNETRFPRDKGDGVERAATTNSAPDTLAVDLNSASYEELQELPGIGPKLAERIIAHRPYHIVEDLQRVPGIGTVTLERLKPHIRIRKNQP
ncbi:MAG: ComEA family DNA-binding protein [Verrucomicrobia bacterium]|nr:ComEA family DNA-binding protein [Verrucomicrobiota bacterium]